MCPIFNAVTDEASFREDGYVVTGFLDEAEIADLWSLYSDSFHTKREVVPYAEALPYYISIFDKDSEHKLHVDDRISKCVAQRLPYLMSEYEVFYSNFMIKFPGDGQIEAHQDFNFTDESRYTAFNLWCPLVDTDTQNGGLFVIAGSHRVFMTQRGPNLPKALTQYNDLLRRYSRWIPLRKGQAIIFDHKLIHYSPPNRTSQPRVAIQSVLKPRGATAVHYVYDGPSGKVRAYRINKQYILENNLWESDPTTLPLDHQQELIPLLSPAEMTQELTKLTVRGAVRNRNKIRAVFQDETVQESFFRDGFAKLPVLGPEEVRQLTDLFIESTGGTVENTEYGMYISLEDRDLTRKQALMKGISGILQPKVSRHFRDCKPHLGSFLIKAPGQTSYTYPHQDWTFVDSPPFVSITVWVALVDTGTGNGAMGFVKGSQWFFDRPVGSPSPPWQTCTQGHEAALYEYLEFVPLKAGEAVAFDNRTIHGATPNLSTAPRLAVAIGMTPSEAPLFHYFLVPGSLQGNQRTFAKLRVHDDFFEHYSVSALREVFNAGKMPGRCVVEETLQDEFLPYSEDEIRQLCEQAGLRPNGLNLGRHGNSALGGNSLSRSAGRLSAAASSLWKTLFRS